MVQSRAEELFGRLEADGEAALDLLVDARESESLFLDFKTSADNGHGNRLHDNDRKHLAKAVSAFANTEGGVIVWGIDCRQSDSAGDVPGGRRPIEQPARFRSWLEGAISGLTVPPVTGSRSVVVPIADRVDAGFVATLIPKSPAAPHQTTGTNQFLVRIGSSFYPAPHGLIAGLFGRAIPPAVSITFVQSNMSAWQIHSNAGFTLSVCVANVGQQLADQAYISAVLPQQGRAKITTDHTHRWIENSPAGNILSLVQPAGSSLPPQAMIPAFQIQLIIGDLDLPPTDFQIDLTVGCSNALPEKTTLKSDLAKLNELLRLLRSNPRHANTSFGLLEDEHRRTIWQHAFGVGYFG